MFDTPYSCRHKIFLPVVASLPVLMVYMVTNSEMRLPEMSVLGRLGWQVNGGLTSVVLPSILHGS